MAEKISKIYCEGMTMLDWSDYIKIKKEEHSKLEATLEQRKKHLENELKGLGGLGRRSTACSRWKQRVKRKQERIKLLKEDVAKLELKVKQKQLSKTTKKTGFNSGVKSAKKIGSNSGVKSTKNIDSNFKVTTTTLKENVPLIFGICAVTFALFYNPKNKAINKKKKSKKKN